MLLSTGPSARHRVSDTAVRSFYDHSLYVRDGNAFHPASEQAILEHARRTISRRFRPGAPILSTPDLIDIFLRLELAPLEYSVFTALFLDRRRRLISFLEMFRGTIDHVSVHPREVCREALARNAAAVIFARNDPSGCAEPMPADELTHSRLVEAFALLDIPVLDYILVGEKCRSLLVPGMGPERSRTSA